MSLQLSWLFFLSLFCSSCIGNSVTSQTREVSLKLPTNITPVIEKEVEFYPKQSALLFFLDSDTGWANCAGNKLCKTIDGGLTWKVIGNEMTNFTVVFNDVNNGWGNSHEKGRESHLMRTTDGGKTWRFVQDLASSIDSITFSETGVGLVATFQTGVFRTSDTGRNWANVSVHTDSDSKIDGKSRLFLDNELETGSKFIAFLDEKRLVSYGNGVWISSSDEASSWQNRVPVGIGFPNDVSIPKRNVVWLVGGSDKLLHTNDGFHWVQTALPKNDYGKSAEFLSFSAVSFISDSEGWVVRDDKTLFHTTDGAKSWSLICKPELQFRDLKFLSSKKGWAVSLDGDLFQTIDGGTTWKIAAIEDEN